MVITVLLGLGRRLIVSTKIAEQTFCARSGYEPMDTGLKEKTDRV